MLAGESAELFAGGLVFFLQRVQVGLGCNGGRVGLTQRPDIFPVLGGCAADAVVERVMLGLSLLQTPGVVVLPGEALLQLVVGGFERLGISFVSR